jgi:hypothetical protein
VLDGNADPDDRVEAFVVPVAVEPAEVVVAVIDVKLAIKPVNFSNQYILQQILKYPVQNLPEISSENAHK